MCSFSNYFPASRHSLPQYTPEQFFLLLSAQVLSLKTARQVKEVHRDCTKLPWNCWTTVCGMSSPSHTSSKANLKNNLQYQGIAQRWSASQIHMKWIQSSAFTLTASSSSLVPQWASVMIRSFNGKEQLEELVKMIAHLPAFLCVCASSTGAFIHASIYFSRTWFNVWPLFRCESHRDVLRKSKERCVPQSCLLQFTHSQCKPCCVSYSQL